MTRFSTRLSAIGCATAIALAPAIAHADDTSFSVSAFGGGAGKTKNFLSGKRLTAGVVPSVYVPLGSDFGLQADGIYARHRGRDFFGGAAHLSAKLGSARVGPYVSYVRSNGTLRTRVWRVGGEAIFDVGPFTLSALAGYEKSRRYTRRTAALPGFTFYDTVGAGGSFFDMVDLRLNLGGHSSVFAGHRYVGGRHAGAAGGRVGLSDAVSLFVEGRAGGHGYRALVGGIKFTLAGSAEKTAMRSSANVANGSGLVNGGSLGGSGTDPIYLLDDLYSGDNGSQILTVPNPPPPPPPVEKPCCGPCYAK